MCLGEHISYQRVHGNQDAENRNVCTSPGPSKPGTPPALQLDWGPLEISSADPVSPESEPHEVINPAEIPISKHTYSDKHSHTCAWACVHTHVHTHTCTHTRVHTHSHFLT